MGVGPVSDVGRPGHCGVWTASLVSPHHMPGASLPTPSHNNCLQASANVHQRVKSPRLGGAHGKEPACQCRRLKETWVRSLGQEDPLEKDMATHSSIFAWKIPWMEEPGGLQSMGVAESDTTEQLTVFLSL